jgi:hypothetical protein
MKDVPQIADSHRKTVKPLGLKAAAVSGVREHFSGLESALSIMQRLTYTVFCVAFKNQESLCQRITAPRM